jgi:ubiquinone/menaquinone biosynthesis C-methylase UbiE
MVASGHLAVSMSSGSRLLEPWLATPETHHRWMADYLGHDNDRFFELAFDRVARVLEAPRDAVVLDVGCGGCAHAVRLAGHGFMVQAVDVSEAALNIAAARVAAEKLEGRITLRREDLLGLSFADRTFDYILCWGVLMHVADIETAIGELARVLKPGGVLVISEGNMRSLEARVARVLRPLRRRRTGERRRTPAGIECWSAGPTGKRLTREADIAWLTRQFEKRGVQVTGRFAGQFTEAYTRVSSRWLKAWIHGFNSWWFRKIRSPHLAAGNVVVLRNGVGR